jgi:hypothetical protein
MEQNRIGEALAGAQPQHSKRAPSKGYTASVYLGPERKSRLDRLQREWRVNRSQAIRFLLDHALKAAEAGKIKPEFETITRAKTPAP